MTIDALLSWEVKNCSLPTLEHMCGVTRIPKTYLKAIGDAQAQAFHRGASPTDKLAGDETVTIIAG